MASSSSKVVTESSPLLQPRGAQRRQRAATALGVSPQRALLMRTLPPAPPASEAGATSPRTSPAPLTPRNKLAALVHLERIGSAPQSPRGAAPSDSSNNSLAHSHELLITPPSAPAVTVTRNLQNSFSAGSLQSTRTDDMCPPVELPAEVQAKRKEALRNSRRMRRQERAAALMHKTSSETLLLRTSPARSMLAASAEVTRVIAFNVDDDESDSESDEERERERRFYPVQVAATPRSRSRVSSNASKQRPLASTIGVSDPEPAVATVPSASDGDSTTVDVVDDVGAVGGGGAEDAVAEQSGSQNGEGGDGDDDDDDDDDAAHAAESKRQFASAKQQFVLMQSLLSGNSCRYNFLKVYETVWRGLDTGLREQFWSSQLGHISFSAIDDQELPTFEILLQNGRLPHAVFKQIMLDLYRTFPYIDRDRPGFDSLLYSALVMYAIYRPDIGYVQGMNFLWGTILLCLPRQAQQLHMMEHVTRRVLPYYFDTDGIGWRVDAAVLAAFMHERCCKLKEFYERELQTSFEDLALELVARWYTTLFVRILVGDQVLRIWDMIMLRGAVTLVQVTLQILNYAYKRELFLNCGCASEFVQRMEARLGQLGNIDGILKTRLADKHIPIEDFELRRRSATRIQLARLRAAAEEE